jgi:type IV pilus assembly protein PilY1
MNFKALIATVLFAVAMSFSPSSQAQTTPDPACATQSTSTNTGTTSGIVSEDFTCAVTSQQWFFFNGACLTAGTGTSLLSPGSVPGCVTLMSSYYYPANSVTGKPQDNALVGGENGFLGSATAPSSPPAGVVGDDNGTGALRFTNGAPYGFFERGAIVSDYTFPTSQGVQITFKTVTYLGNSGGSGADGADGISFFLLDGCTPLAGGVLPSGCGVNSIYGSGQTFPAIGATGGSLAYSCSNANAPFDGLVGAYLGLGIDEYGNFLNGTTNTLSEPGTTASGDNTASGGGYQPGRIGLRGAGSVSWQALTTAYGAPNANGPYYPASLATTCSNQGQYNSATNSCGESCPSGSNLNGAGNACLSCNSGYTYSSQGGGTCGACSSGATYNATTNTCSPAGTCSVGTYNTTTGNCDNSCPASGTYSSTAAQCGSCSVTGGTVDFSNWTTSHAAYCDGVCPSGYTAETKSVTYPNVCMQCSQGSLQRTGNPKTWSCTSSGTLSVKTPVLAVLTPTSSNNVSTPTLLSQTPNSAAGTTGAPIFTSAVQKTCSTGHLWNYSNALAPTDQGPATLPTDPTNANSKNTAGIMDYNAIPNAYSVIPTPTQDPVNGFKIAAEGSTTRASAAPILYNLKITQDGLLSLSYSYNGGTAVPVISSTKITSSNGPLPSSFRFGFAGSTGGSNNVHEILCFKAAPVESSGSSGAINVYHNPYIHTGTQIFIANYFPSDWSGQLEAIGITNGAGGAPVVAQVNWDGRCVLTGVDPATGECDSTGQSGPAAEAPGSRVMLTWDPVGQTPEAFEWGSLTAAQQATLTAGDATPTSNRLAYLRGDRSNEITASGSGIYRARTSVLSDIVDSSPNWVGPPQQPYTLISSWIDQLYPLVTQPENAPAAQKYADYLSNSATGQQSRANIVYAGANDGFLHGFRAGALDINGNLVTTNTPNDGQEVLAYMPGAVLNNIHPVGTTGAVVSQLDFSNTQYSHNWYVDASPAQGDVFYGNKWHTWVVSGVGPGGAAIFALDVTDPTQFSESSPATTVKGEWTPGNITCPNQTVTACGANLGFTYGSPQIRRFHNGQWGFVFGNGYGTTNGASGIYIALLDKTTGAPTFYWFPTNLTFSSGTPNGISYVWAADYDFDNTVDYIYAGDLLGNLWRFDVTSSSAANWGVSASSPLFNAGSPITTQPLLYTLKTITSTVNAVGLNISNAPEREIIVFGTGRQIPQTLSSGAIFASGTQALYGIWDWDQGVAGTSGWNNLSPNQQNIGLTSSPGKITTSMLQSQTLTEIPQVVAANGSTTGGTATLTHNVVCWNGTSTCGSSNNQMGWYTQLPSTNEQIIYNPLANIQDGDIVFNTYIPANSGVLSCSQNGPTGFSIGINPESGGGLPLPLFNVGGTSYDGVQTNAAGTASVINSGSAGGGKDYLVTHNGNGAISFTQMNNYTVTTGHRVYWTQKR